MYVDRNKLKIGMSIRTKRPSELEEPEWCLDHSSGGKFYVNYGKHRVIPVDLLGSEYIIDELPYGKESLWVYQEYEGPDGKIYRTHSTLIWDTLIAEILDPIDPVQPICNCGKDKTGRQDVGPHSYWCNTVQGYTRINSKKEV